MEQYKSKNLIAERNRRTKLNNRLLALRALVPNITKMSKAKILDDAFDYVKELQNQVEKLQQELLEISDEDGDHQETDKSTIKKEVTKSTISQGRGMEERKVEVVVSPINASKLVMKVLCENRRGVLVKLLEAISDLGLEVTNINVTTFEDFLLSMIWAEGKDAKMIQIEHVKEWMVEIVQCL
ncbi:transcription factor ABORTED MICROSPORES-like [Tasmannia lanceolata]|uniref:transcription factor ABORTED MICROSPORES-like n=1 Tax=Tasmannia lanceolata TaxID=3420 RepID=UPI00406472D1